MTGRVGIATPAEIAADLGISERTLTDEIRDDPTRGFPWIQITRQRWGVPWAAYDAWLLTEAAKHSGTASPPAETITITVAAPAGTIPVIQRGAA